MMQQEFEKLTKVKVTSEEYNVIEAAYMACQEDKQVFCKQWLKKDGIRNLLKDRLAEIKSFNVIVTVSTTIYVDANTPEDAIKKVQKTLDANDAGTAMQLGENLSCALRDGGYQVTNAVEVDE